MSQLTHQVCHLQQSLSSLQQETDTTITKLRQELADKVNIQISLSLLMLLLQPPLLLLLLNRLFFLNLVAPISLSAPPASFLLPPSPQKRIASTSSWPPKAPAYLGPPSPFPFGPLQPPTYLPSPPHPHQASIVETLQQQIRMKMFINMTKQPSPVMAALADLHGEQQQGEENEE